MYKTCNTCGYTKEATKEFFHKHRDGFKAMCKECRRLTDFGLDWLIPFPNTSAKQRPDPRPFDEFQKRSIFNMSKAVGMTGMYVYNTLLLKQGTRCAGCLDNLQKEFRPDLNYIKECGIIHLDSAPVMVCGHCLPYSHRKKTFINPRALRSHVKRFAPFFLSDATDKPIRVVAKTSPPSEVLAPTEPLDIYKDIKEMFPSLRRCDKTWKIEVFGGHKISRSPMLAEALLQWVGTMHPLRASILLRTFVGAPNDREIHMRTEDPEAWKIREKEKADKLDAFVLKIETETTRCKHG